jgi:transposase
MEALGPTCQLVGSDFGGALPIACAVLGALVLAMIVLGFGPLRGWLEPAASRLPQRPGSDGSPEGLGPVFNGEVRLTIIVLTDRVLPEVGYATTARVDRCRMGAAGAAPAAAESGQAAPGRILNAILWKLATGAPWRDLPERYGPWQTVYTRFWRWTRAGVWDRLLAAVERRADAAGALDGELHFVDGTIVRAHQHAAGAKGGPPTGGARPEPGWLLDQGPSPRRRPRPAADGGADARAAARGHRP